MQRVSRVCLAFLLMGGALSVSAQEAKQGVSQQAAVNLQRANQAFHAGYAALKAQHLEAASMDFARDGSTGWAAGDSGPAQRAYIAEYANGVWRPYPQQPSVSQLTLVRAGLFGDVWAAGGAENKTNLQPAGLILRYDGHTWKTLGDPANGSILGITDVANGDAWAVGYNGRGTALLWYHGGYWRTYYTNG